MNRIERIRSGEKKYHDACYENHRLFEPGTWLHRPVRTVLETLAYFQQDAALRTDGERRSFS